MSNPYPVGTVVFAKLKGYPWWPARVRRSLLQRCREVWETNANQLNLFIRLRMKMTCQSTSVAKNRSSDLFGPSSFSALTTSKFCICLRHQKEQRKEDFEPFLPIDTQQDRRFAIILNYLIQTSFKVLIGQTKTLRMWKSRKSDESDEWNRCLAIYFHPYAGQNCLLESLPPKRLVAKR